MGRKEKSSSELRARGIEIADVVRVNLRTAIETKFGTVEEFGREAKIPQKTIRNFLNGNPKNGKPIDTGIGKVAWMCEGVGSSLAEMSKERTSRDRRTNAALKRPARRRR